MWAKIGQWLGAYVVPHILKAITNWIKRWWNDRQDRLRREGEAEKKAKALEEAQTKEEARDRFGDMP